MLITSELLQVYNGITQIDDDEHKELVTIHIGTAQRIISSYVGFDCEIVLTDLENYTDSDRAIFKNVALRIATLLQLEDNSNIGVSSNNEIGVSRSYLNIVDYTPYLKPLSVFRKSSGV